MPKSQIECKKCGEKYWCVDRPTQEAPCPKCKTIGNKPIMITFGGGTMCYKCNKKHDANKQRCPDCNTLLIPQR